MELERLSLANLGGGAVVEKFGKALEKVLENVLDPNTKAEKERSITLTVTFRPSESRHRAGVTVDVRAKLASARPYETQAYFGLDPKTGEVLIAEDNPEQVTIESFIQTKDNTVPIDAKKRAAGESDD